MGTNYYAESSPCKECGHVMMRTHIGKASHGWPFLFRCYQMHPTTYREWLILLNSPKVTIRDEYGDLKSLEDFVSMVQYNRQFEANISPEYKKYYYYDDEGYRFSFTEFN